MRTFYIIKDRKPKLVSLDFFEKALTKINPRKIYTIHVDYKSVYLFLKKNLEPIHQYRTTKMIIFKYRKYDIITSIPVKKSLNFKP